ncbi:MAG: ComEC/Rec2 family competence protein [Salinibacterium sp.]|nr:ComEC/Rec2 family competence protein [Salinibacterium sp.]
MNRSDAQLAVPAVCGWLAAAILIGFPALSIPALVCAWLSAGVLVLLRPRLALVALIVALCCTSIALHSPSRQPQSLRDAATAHHSVSVIVSATQTVLPGGDSFRATLDEVDDVAVSVPVVVFGGTAKERLGIGTTLAFQTTLVATDPADDRAFLLFPRNDLAVVGDPPWWLDWANALRARFLAATTHLPGDGGDLLAGLAIGDTTAVSDELSDAMKASSLTHLTAVSGANCAVVIGLVMLAGGAAGAPRGFRIGASGAVLLGFVVLVTPEPSVLRAALMAALVLLALASGRPVQGLPVLSLAVIALLVVDPWLARSFGFVLSVLATGGLLLIAAPLARKLERWLPRWLALVVAVPLAARLACQPVIIILNAAIPTYGVVANMLAEPAAPVATVVGLAACIALVTVPPVGELLCAVAWLPSAWIAAIAHFFAGAPFAQLPWPEGLVGVVLAVVASVAVVLALRWRWAVVGVALVAVIYAGVFGGLRLGELLTRPTDWQFAGCDVGQGDAVVVRSGGQIMLIDTGPDSARLTHCLSELGIDRVDVLVLTHWDKDHVGGVDAMVGRADRVLVGPADGNSERVIADLVAGGAAVEHARQGLSGVLGSLDWRVVWPPTRMVGIEPGNPASVTIMVDCVSGCLSAVFLGDLGEAAQERLPHIGHVDVVKVSHHGSADQSEAFYRELGATVGIIGVGADNGYGHPTDRLLDILGSAGTVAERTDLHGLILVSSGDSPGAVSVWTAR